MVRQANQWDAGNTLSSNRMAESPSDSTNGRFYRRVGIFAVDAVRTGKRYPAIYRISRKYRQENLD